ncbi:hypothetical protein AVEN_123581-1 [Araneus ventricosus]|uniref:Uncharacterized protein n=1 Tax=Araneus ventricosus TaxID=182803 RepID=A0A4Y2SDN0_ARAVE|nr:hypothetical protein AVEN_123581-1 [Araneus ventricosus]
MAGTTPEAGTPSLTSATVPGGTFGPLKHDLVCKKTPHTSGSSVEPGTLGPKAETLPPGRKNGKSIYGCSQRVCLRQGFKVLNLPTQYSSSPTQISSFISTLDRRPQCRQIALMCFYSLIGSQIGIGS